MRRPHSREAEDVGSYHLDHRSLALQSARQIRQGLCPRLRKTGRPAEYSAGLVSDCKELQLHSF